MECTITFPTRLPAPNMSATDILNSKAWRGKRWQGARELTTYLR